MTTTDANRVLAALNDFRVDAAGRFASLEEKISATASLADIVAKLLARVEALEQQQAVSEASAGKLRWRDVGVILGSITGTILCITGVVVATRG